MPDINGLRRQPASPEAERAVLGACLIDPQALVNVTEILTPEDFYDYNYRDVYTVIAEIARGGHPVDALTVSEVLKDRNLLDKLGGQSFFATIVDGITTAANAEYYAHIVREKALHRRLINAGNAIANMGYDEARDLNEMLEDAERMIFEVSRTRNESNFRSLAEVVKPAVEHIAQLYNSDSPGINGIPFGFREIDRLTNGMQRGALNIIAARPSMGKTALAMNIARNVAVKQKLPVLVYSLEMGAEQLAVRLLGAESHVNLHDLNNGTLAKRDWDDLTQAATILSAAPLYIDDSSVLTSVELKARSRRFKAKHGELGLIVVDYLQLMTPSRTTDNKANDVAEISRSLKAVARELDVPVIALSQLSRNVENRDNKSPLLSDLRDSGAIEQDADLVGMIYRASYYAKDEETRNDNSATVNIAKNRNGPTGEANLVFLREYTQFVDKDMWRSE